MTFYNNASTLCILFFMTINSCTYTMESPSDAMSGSMSNSPSGLTELLLYYAPTKESLASAYEAGSKLAVSVYENALIPAYNTVTIEANDNIAFIKLGYPITNLEAQKELRKNLENYTDYCKLKKQLLDKKRDYKNDTVRQQYDLLYQFMIRRQKFVERAANSLPFRLDGIKLARHCLKYHCFEPVMTVPTKNIISLFIKEQMEAEKKSELPFATPLQELLALYKEQSVEEKKDDKGGKNEGNQSGGIGNS
jgi:hypothetical protein